MSVINSRMIKCLSVLMSVINCRMVNYRMTKCPYTKKQNRSMPILN